ncbi:MAG: hypothetical protein M3Q71_16985 [Chloroflexota bacterium]|nr:hypothetical protein [Chloroflexota bacterium]MDP9472336.1 hypothetical protein [Chloroflexota bacterium]
MRGRPSVWTRTQRLATTIGDPFGEDDEETLIRRQVEIIAAERGVPVAALLAEAETAMARWAEDGSITRATVVERVAMEHGIDPDELRAELAAMGLGWAA